MKKTLKYFITAAGSCSVFFLFAFPASTNYSLKSFEFGSGGDATMNSTNYSLEGLAGEVATDRQSSTNYAVNSGLEFVQMTNTPGSPTFTNDNNWYDKLKIVISQSDNPSDTTYAVAISDDNFVTTRYVQSDMTIGSNLGTEDFLSYTGWGGASGSLIIGLDHNTIYYVKVKARQGNFTEGPFGPVANASTVALSISFDLDISSADTETSAPYGINFGELNIGSVTTSSEKIWVDFETNAYAGGAVFLAGDNVGLTSINASYTITSATADLAVATSGYGLKGNTVAESSGGPLTLVSPYNGASDNVGILDTTLREVFSASAPIVAGRGSAYLKTKISSTIPPAEDYSDLITAIASATF